MMMALTKAEMADKLFDQLGLNKREAKDLVEGFLNVYATHWKMDSKSSCQDLGISI